MQELNISIHRDNLIDLHIPKDWKISTLNELSKKIIDIDHKMPKKTSDGIPFLSVRFLVKNDLPFLEIRKEDDAIEYISNKDYEYYSKRFDAKYNDILYSRFGTIGIAKLINIYEKLIASYSIVLIRPITDVIVPLFLTYALNSQIVRKQAKLMTQGSSNQNFHLSEIRKLRIPLPPFMGQQKIASILSKIDEMIQKTDQVIEQTQRLKKGLMQKLLTEGIGHTEFKEENLAFGFLKKQIPVNWRIVKLNDLCKVVRGGSPRPAGDPKYFGGKIPWITVGELTKDDHMYLDSVTEGLTELGKERSRYLEKDTVVIANSGATLGVPKILNISGCINDGVAAFLNLNSDLLSEFLYFTLFSWINILRNTNQGIGQPNLNTEMIGNLYFPLPTVEEQRKIVSTIVKVDLKIRYYRQHRSKVEELKKGLMQKLLTGKIRVKV